MKATILYKVASVVLVLFAAGHNIGFKNVDPKWGVDPLVAMMRGLHFKIQGSDRTYWDFYLGFGFFVTVLLLFAAVACWQLGMLKPEVLSQMQLTSWALAAAFAAVTYLSWRYFFPTPLVFSALTTALLAVAAVLARG